MAFEKIIFLLSLFVIISNAQRTPRVISTKEIAMECEFGDIKDVFSTGEELYACTVKTPMKNSLFKVTSVTPDPHKDSGKTHASVELLVIEEDVEFFPSNLETIFTSLKAIYIKGSIFKLITKEDLAVFASLEFFKIEQSPIGILEKNLFSSNTNLKNIQIESFLVFYIHETAFEGLALTNLQVNALSCTLVDATNLVTNIKTNCQRSEVFTQRYKDVILDKAEISTYIETCEKSLNDKTDEVLKLKEKGDENDKLKIQLTAKDSEISDLKGKISTCEGDKKILEDKISDLEDQIYEPTGNCRFVDGVDGYTCVVREITLSSGEDQKIIWKGTHRPNIDSTLVKALIIESRKFEVLPLKVGESFANLKSFAVKTTELKILKRNDFQTLEALEKLVISGNKIDEIELGTFDILTQLTHLDLTSNKIANFPSKAFDKLTKVKHLDVSTNLLPSLDETLIPLVNSIERFRAKENKLKRVDIYFVWRLRNSKLIDFSDNEKCKLIFDASVTTTFANFNAFFYEIVLGKC